MIAAPTTSIPSPDQSVWHLGPVPLRAYALCILVGIFVAMWSGDRRWVARGGRAGLVYDVAVWAVPLGILGGRIYHVMTDWTTYFGAGGSGLAGAVAIWQGGLGIWGAIALGAVGAWIGCRRQGVPLPPFGDSVCVGVALAQAIGRMGNWFNQELFGRPTDLPWGLEIAPIHRPAGYEQYATFHPTFLYEALWLVGVAGLVVWADRRWTMGHGRAFALYVAAYCVGSPGHGAAADRPGDPPRRHPDQRVHVRHRRGRRSGVPRRERPDPPRPRVTRRPPRCPVRPGIGLQTLGGTSGPRDVGWLFATQARQSAKCASHGT